MASHKKVVEKRLTSKYNRNGLVSALLKYKEVKNMFYFTIAIVSTSTSTSFGNCFAATHERAGLFVKYSA